MSTDETTTNSNAGGLIRQSLHDFQTASATWEADVERLFEEIDRFLTDSSPAEGQSNAASEEISSLRRLIEQQTDVLAALVHTLTGAPQTPADSVAETDAVINSVLGQDGPLQCAAASD